MVLYRGTVCSVTVNVDTVEGSLNTDDAINLTGSGSNYYYLGNLTMAIYNNSSGYPHNLDLVCSTYDAVNNQFVAVHSGGTSEIKIGIQKNFDLQGNFSPMAYINPVNATTLIRTIDAQTCPEIHTLYFYIVESPNNTFSKGIYTASFVLLFQS